MTAVAMCSNICCGSTHLMSPVWYLIWYSVGSLLASTFPHLPRCLKPHRLWMFTVYLQKYTVCMYRRMYGSHYMGMKRHSWSNKTCNIMTQNTDLFWLMHGSLPQYTRMAKKTYTVNLYIFNVSLYSFLYPFSYKTFSVCTTYNAFYTGGNPLPGWTDIQLMLYVHSLWRRQRN